MRIKLLPDELEKYAVIKAIGIGGGGSNAINLMYEKKILGVEFVAANTDAKSLGKVSAHIRLQIGEKVTKGLGCGGNPGTGRAAAEEDKIRLKNRLDSADLVFLVSGMGGGTGTGATPYIAEMAHSLGILTVGIITKPFKFEGKARMKQAEAGIAAMKQYCDATIIVPNDKILKMCPENTEAQAAFRHVDEIIYEIVRSVAEIITKQGIINRDMADVRAVLHDSGEAFIGLGESSVPGSRAREAAQKALNNPMLEEVTINGAGKILVTIFGGKDITIGEIEEAMNTIHARVSQDAHIFYGQVLDPGIGDAFKIAVIATDFKDQRQEINKEVTVSKEEYYKQPAFKIWKPRKLI